MTVRWTVRSAGDQGAEFAPRIEPHPSRHFRQNMPPADLAHLVERDLAKVEVAGSSPVIRSKKREAPLWSFSIFVPTLRSGARSARSPRELRSNLHEWKRKRFHSR